MDPRHVQADLNLQPGHSGAPLFDSTGQAVGMLTFKLDELKAYQAPGILPHTLNTALEVGRIHAFLLAFPAIRRQMPRHAAESNEVLAAAESATTQVLVQ